MEVPKTVSTLLKVPTSDSSPWIANQVVQTGSCPLCRWLSSLQQTGCTHVSEHPALKCSERECHLQQFCLGLKCRAGALWAHLALLILYSSHERILCGTYWFSPSSDIQMFLPWRVECGWGVVQPQVLSCSTLPVQSGYTIPELLCLQHRQGSVAATLVTDLPMSMSMVQALLHLTPLFPRECLLYAIWVWFGPFMVEKKTCCSCALICYSTCVTNFTERQMAC